MDFNSWSTQSLQNMLMTMPMPHITDTMQLRQLMPRLFLADGESLSVQVGEHCYCSPRSNQGPWVSVEVGFPSCRPPESWMQHAENPDSPTNTVYARVPFEFVMMFIGAHGGIDRAATFTPAAAERIKF